MQERLLHQVLKVRVRTVPRTRVGRLMAQRLVRVQRMADWQARTLDHNNSIQPCVQRYASQRQNIEKRDMVLNHVCTQTRSLSSSVTRNETLCTINATSSTQAEFRGMPTAALSRMWSIQKSVVCQPIIIWICCCGSDWR